MPDKKPDDKTKSKPIVASSTQTTADLAAALAEAQALQKKWTEEDAELAKKKPKGGG